MVKAKHGLIGRENYNKPKPEDAKQPQCPPEREAAIESYSIEGETRNAV